MSKRHQGCIESCGGDTPCHPHAPGSASYGASVALGGVGLRLSKRAGRSPTGTKIFYRSQEALESLHVVPKTTGVKNARQGRTDLTTKKRAPIRPNLDTEADIKISDVTPAQEEQMDSASGNAAAQHPQVDANDIAAPGSKRKRNATAESTSTSKKVKREEPTAMPELTSSIQTRSKVRLAAQRKSEVVETAVVDQGVHEEGPKRDGVAGRLFGRISSVWASLTQGRSAL